MSIDSTAYQMNFRCCSWATRGVTLVAFVYWLLPSGIFIFMTEEMNVFLTWMIGFHSSLVIHAVIDM